MKYLTPKEVEEKVSKEFEMNEVVSIGQGGKKTFEITAKELFNLIHQQRIQDLESVEEMIIGLMKKDITKDSISVFEDAMNYGHNEALQDLKKLLQALKK